MTDMAAVSSTMRSATTTQVEEIRKRADELEYNRQLVLEAELQPEMTHVFDALMIHEHAQMRPVDPHWRTMAYLWVKGQDQPIQAFMDVPMDLWDTLPKVQKLVPLDSIKLEDLDDSGSK